VLPRKIRVNAVAPGPIATPIIGRAGMTQEQQDAYTAGITTRVPMGRSGTSEEVAGAVAFSRRAMRRTSPRELNVDGAWASCRFGAHCLN